MLGWICICGPTAVYALAVSETASIFVKPAGQHRYKDILMLLAAVIAPKTAQNANQRFMHSSCHAIFNHQQGNSIQKYRFRVLAHS